MAGTPRVRIWETRFLWLTTWSREQLREKHSLKTQLSEDRMVWGRSASRGHFHMTNVHLAKSTAVVNRFDSPFYPEGSAEKWYANWIAQVLQNPEALVAVAEHGEEGEVAGYFIYLPGKRRKVTSPCTKAFCLSSSPSTGDGICTCIFSNFCLKKWPRDTSESRWTTPRRCPIIPSFEITPNQVVDLKRSNSSCFAGHTDAEAQGQRGIESG